MNNSLQRTGLALLIVVANVGIYAQERRRKRAHKFRLNLMSATHR